MKKLAAILLLSFLVANVGLPIALVACPMLNEVTTNCSMCGVPPANNATQTISSAPASCCTKIEGKAPLKFESSEAKVNSLFQQKVKATFNVPAIATSADFSFGNPLYVHFVGPPSQFGTDQYILVSCLRI